MTDSEYLALAEAALDAIERAVDASGASIECERSGNVLTLECDDASKIIVNMQAAMHEIWVAAKRGGFHYRYDTTRQPAAWRDTRDSGELFQALSGYLSAQSGESIELTPD